MSTDRKHLEKIQEQFSRQGEAYRRLKYVSDEEGLKRVVGMARVDSEDRVVDFACGPAFLTMEFAEVCAEAVGVDATMPFLEGAKSEAVERGLDNVTFVQADVEQTEMESDRFDVAICRAAFHHFPHPSRVLAEMKRVVKPGAKVIVIDMTTSDDVEMAANHNALEQLCDPTHVRALNESEFEGLFEKEGLAIVHKGRGETRYPLEEWISHGGPSEENTAKIRSLMEASLEVNRLGLKIRREDGEIHFSHAGIGIVSQKARA